MTARRRRSTRSARSCGEAGSSTPISSGVVLISGGADSACAAAGLAQAIGPDDVHALHVNYGLRDVGRPRRAHLPGPVLAAADRPPHRAPGELAATGTSRPRARDVRYAAAERLRVRTGGDWIATGHTRTDLAETVLYRLAVSPGRGALRGLPAQQRPGRPAAARARARRDAPAGRPRRGCRSPTTRRTSTRASRATGSAPRSCPCCASSTPRRSATSPRRRPS